VRLGAACAKSFVRSRNAPRLDGGVSSAIKHHEVVVARLLSVRERSGLAGQ
jgi:hypothetical protein